MSIFNLNEMSVMSNGNTSVVFNNGIAGKVDNVGLMVTKKSPEEGEQNPDYKVVYTDENGAQINQAFYYNKVQPVENKSEEANKVSIHSYLNRIMDIAKLVVPEGFKYPEPSSNKEAMDILFKVIKDNAEDKKVAVFVTYGTKDYPSKYLNLRYFNFIEKAANTGFSRLVVKGDDLMERPMMDAPKESTDAPKTNEPAW